MKNINSPLPLAISPSIQTYPNSLKDYFSSNNNSFWYGF